MAAIAAALFLISTQSVHPQAAQARPSASPAASASILEANESELGLGGTAAGGTQAARGNGVNAWSFVQMFLILGLVAAAIYGVSVLVKKYNRKASSDSRELRVLASAGLLTTFTPPPLPRPPAWICAFTAQMPPPSWRAAPSASRGVTAR